MAVPEEDTTFEGTDQHIASKLDDKPRSGEDFGLQG